MTNVERRGQSVLRFSRRFFTQLCPWCECEVLDANDSGSQDMPGWLQCDHRDELREQASARSQTFGQVTGRPFGVEERRRRARGRHSERLHKLASLAAAERT